MKGLVIPVQRQVDGGEKHMSPQGVHMCVMLIDHAISEATHGAIATAVSPANRGNAYLVGQNKYFTQVVGFLKGFRSRLGSNTRICRDIVQQMQTQSLQFTPDLTVDRTNGGLIIGPAEYQAASGCGSAGLDSQHNRQSQRTWSEGSESSAESGDRVADSGEDGGAAGASVGQPDRPVAVRGRGRNPKGEKGRTKPKKKGSTTRKGRNTTAPAPSTGRPPAA